MENLPKSVSSPTTPTPPESQSGVRFATDTSVKASPQPETKGLPREGTHIGVDGVPGNPPSSFQNTNLPYLARVFELIPQVVERAGIRDTLSEVDTYILDLVKERNWVDNESSYKDVLEELRVNLGLHRNLDIFVQLEKLSHGVKLLRLQAMHKKRDKEIQEQLNKNTNAI